MHTYVKNLVESKLLLHINKSSLSMDNGVIIVSCGDCDKFPELLKFQKLHCSKTANHERVHLLTLNGGALVLHTDSPLNQAGKSSALMLDIAETMPLKDIECLNLYAHFVCGKAKAMNLSVEDHLLWLAKAGLHCQERLPKAKIQCFMHVDANTDTKFKTYYFDHLNWLQLYGNLNSHSAIGM